MRRIALVLAPLALGLALSACQKQASAPAAAASNGPEAKPGVAVSGGTLVLPAHFAESIVVSFDDGQGEVGFVSSVTEPSVEVPA
mgnify:CR=1 FL=1